MMIVFLENESINLVNGKGTFSVNAIELLEWIARQTEEIIDYYGGLKGIKKRAELTREHGIIPYSSSIIPAERTLQIESMEDFIALQSLWVKGIFSGSNIILKFPRWKCEFSIYRTQHSLNSTDLVVSSTVKSGSGQTYHEAVNAVRINIPHFWGESQTGQMALAREIRQFLKGKPSSQGADEWNTEFLELAGKVVSFVFAAEATRSHLMLPIGMMANDLIKFGEIDYGSYAPLSLTAKNYDWRGTIVPYFWECVKEAVGLRSASEYLATGGSVSGSNDLNKAKKVVDSMLSIVAAYLDSYLRLGKNAKAKYDFEAVASNDELMDFFQDLLCNKVLTTGVFFG